MNEQIRKLFPVTENYTYLNSAAVSPMPTMTAEAVFSQLDDVSKTGTLHFVSHIQTKERARKMLAEMLNVRHEQVAFLRNTSDGFSAVAGGMNWRKGDNIVSFEREFPSNFYAWRRVRDKFDVELRLCGERGGKVDTDELIGLIDANTKLVSISAVQFASGFRADLERIGRAARKVDALFAVDIIQGLGALPFDLPAQFVDIAAGASHKWLFSPEGSGYLYLNERARARVEPILVGWISVADSWNFEDSEQHFQPNALALESGTSGISLLHGLEQSLKLLRETGAANIEKYLEDLTDYLCELTAEKNYEIVSSRVKGEKSQIVCLKYRGNLTSGEIAKRLEAQSIIVSPRGDRLRVAPHIFNNRADIEHLISHLPD